MDTLLLTKHTPPLPPPPAPLSPGTPLLLVALGEWFCERSACSTLGQEGMMLDGRGHGLYRRSDQRQPGRRSTRLQMLPGILMSNAVSH